MVADTTFAALSQRDSDLIRKTLDAIVFVAPMGTAVPTSLTSGTTAALQTLPTGWTDIGWVDKSNAVDMANGVTASPVDSFGSLYPTRSDVTNMNKTIAVTAQETKALTIGLYSQVDMAGVTADATTGEVQIKYPVRPSTFFYRLMTVWVDLAGTDSIFGAFLYPRVSITALANMKLTAGTDAMARGMTFTAYPDKAVGAAEVDLYGGPGWKSRKAAMGF